MNDYEEKLKEWKIRQGVPIEPALEPMSPGEIRMLSEDLKSTGKSYCWKCGGEFLIREMVLDLSPYNQMTDHIADDGYIEDNDRVRLCRECNED